MRIRNAYGLSTLVLLAFNLAVASAQTGDALPEGALRRLGTLRWRHGEPITFVAAPPDGKTLVTATNDATLLVWDRETGKLLRQLTPPAAEPAAKVVVRNIYTQGLTRAAMTSDGKRLAVVLPTNVVQLWDVETGKALQQLKAGPNGIFAMDFSPNNKLLGVRSADRFTYLFDAETGKELRKLKAENPAGPNRVVFGGGAGSGIAFSHDGKIIATPDLELDNNKVVAFVTYFDTASGKELRRLELPNSAITALAFSPDGKMFAHTISNKVHLREADTGKEIRQFVANAAANLMVFSPDSQTLAVKSRDQVVRLYETATGKLTHTLGQPILPGNGMFINYNSTAAHDVIFSRDGKTLIVGGSQTPRFFDVATGKEQPLPTNEGHRGAVSAVLTTPDGKTLLSRGADNAIRTWNALTGAELRHFDEPAGTSSVGFSPDAKLGALGNGDGTLRVLHTADGKEKWQAKAHQGSVAAVAFSRDGKKLATRGAHDGILRIYDVEKGAELKQITWQTINAGNNGAVIVRSTNTNTPGAPLLFSPDGQTVVTYIAPQQLYVQGQQQVQPDSNCFRFWDVATGKQIRQVELPPGRTVHHLAYSPDGRLLVSENLDKTVSLWEIASGRERSHLGEPVAAPPVTSSTAFVVINGVVRSGQVSAAVGVTIAVSPDGSLIASAGANNTIRVWDMPFAKKVATFKGHRGAIASLAFAADGKTLLSGSNDTTILVWDLARIKREPRPQVADLSAKQLDALWTDLVSNDAAAAGKAVQTLIAASKPTVAYLKDHVPPAAPVDGTKIEQWINDLDHSNFAKRSIAMSSLEKLGELAVPALQKVLISKASLETRRRVEPLLEKLTAGSFSAEQIRILRAIEVLDKIGDADARQLLERLASGAPGALTTRQAQAALDRK
jgi:WD40 repeat protein